ncbi:hypothetical protein [Microbispora hainanensis]|uniref:hypothetical protein n=1 Tax=Microbispora hainanensis TaxID=568844 RepID=UPI003245F453
MELPTVQIPVARTLLALLALALVPRVVLPMARTLLARTALARPARVRAQVPPIRVVVVGVVCGRRGWWWGRFVRWPRSWR